MTECNSHETHNIYPNLNDQQQFRLNKSNEIKDYSITEIKETELISKRKSIIKTKKYKKIFMLARSKLNSIESKTSEGLINSEKSLEDFVTIINEEKNYRQLKESIRMMNSLRRDTEKINLIEEGKKIGNDD